SRVLVFTVPGARSRDARGGARTARLDVGCLEGATIACAPLMRSVAGTSLLLFCVATVCASGCAVDRAGEDIADSTDALRAPADDGFSFAQDRTEKEK